MSLAQRWDIVVIFGCSLFGRSTTIQCRAISVFSWLATQKEFARFTTNVQTLQEHCVCQEVHGN